MTANREDTHPDFDDDAPDLSTPEWTEKFMNAPVNAGEPIDPNPISVTTLPDGYVRMTFKRLDEPVRQTPPLPGAPPTKPAATSAARAAGELLPPTTGAVQPAHTARKGSSGKKRSTA